jgi:autotransporter-associated beta strand protein
MSKRSVLSGIVAAAFLLLSSMCPGADVYWTLPPGQAGDWSVAANWGGTVPSSSDNAWIANGGTTNITQAGETYGTLSLGNSAGSGAVLMTGGNLSANSEQYVGYSGTGSFIQSDGINSVRNILYLGFNAGSGGTYNLSGNGQLSAGNEFVSLSGAGTFAQSGGVNLVSGRLGLGLVAGTIGTYSLSGGQLSAASEGVGESGKGTFTQSGGTNCVSDTLNVSYGMSSGTYSLSGGQLFAKNEYVRSNMGDTSSFQQSGGMNTVSSLGIDSNAKYLLTGGTLQVNGNLGNQGIVAGGSGPAVLNANGILDMSSGTWQNLGAVSVNMSLNSLLIVPAGFNTATGFASYSTLGLTHTVGTTLNVPAGQGFSGSISISDPVNCQGTIVAPFLSSINLSGGLSVSGTGTVNLGNSGWLTTNDLLSGISGGSLSVTEHDLGKGGTGTFNHSGGTYAVAYLYSGVHTNDSGIYNLSGNGQLSASWEYFGSFGKGVFTQSGGTNTSGNLDLGSEAGSHGVYTMTAGKVSASDESVGNRGTGTFTQSGGTNHVARTLTVGNIGGIGAYDLSGSGQLSAVIENVGCISGATASFQQTGGTNTVSTLSVGSGGSYLLAGGTLQVASLSNQGIFAGGSGPAALSANGILDLSSGTWQNLAAISLSLGANSLSIVPAGFNPSTGFGSYSTLGLTHTVGTTLNVPADQGIAGSGLIRDPVNCQGFVTATDAAGSPSINLSGGLTLSGAGKINLANGDLTTNDSQSAITGGSLFANNHYVGSSGIGAFAQSGGTNSTGYYRYLGYNAGDRGTYTLTGIGLLHTGYYEYLGYSGAGIFTQSGGTNSCLSLYLGYNVGSSGTYSLSDSGHLLTDNDEYLGREGSAKFTQSGGSNSMNYLFLDNGTYSLSGNAGLSASEECVGSSGVGTFTQTGGTNTIINSLALGYNSSTSGTYNLSGGVLVLASLKGTGSFAFNFGGGTLQAGSGFSTSVPMTLGVGGSGATFDTCDHAVTLSGTLSGPGSVIKTGAGTLILGGSNTYTGGTTITAGTLQVGNGWVTGSIVGDVADNAALVFNRIDNITFPGVITGTGSLTQAGWGMLTLSGSNLFWGPTTVSGGALNVLGNFALQGSTVTMSYGSLSFDASLWKGVAYLGGLSGSGSLVLQTNAAAPAPVLLYVGGNWGDSTYSGSMSGPGSLTKIGAGELVLSGIDTYTGGTFVTAGVLEVTNPAALPDGASLTDGANAAAIFEGAAVPVSSPAAVPEPSTLALLGTGLIALLGLWSRRSVVHGKAICRNVVPWEA